MDISLKISQTPHVTVTTADVTVQDPGGITVMAEVVNNADREVGNVAVLATSRDELCDIIAAARIDLGALKHQEMRTVCFTLHGKDRDFVTVDLGVSHPALDPAAG